MFQLTLPVRGATSATRPYISIHNVSTHAPRAGSDRYGFHTNRATKSFNSRSPCGERLTRFIGATLQLMFQLTLPVRGATSFHRLVILSERFNSRSPCGERQETINEALIYEVSTHAPRAGSDGSLRFTERALPSFQLTLPERGATPRTLQTSPHKQFQLTLPERGATRQRRPRR